MPLMMACFGLSSSAAAFFSSSSFAAVASSLIIVSMARYRRIASGSWPVSSAGAETRRALVETPVTRPGSASVANQSHRDDIFSAESAVFFFFSDEVSDSSPSFVSSLVSSASNVAASADTRSFPLCLRTCCMTNSSTCAYRKSTSYPLARAASRYGLDSACLRPPGATR